MVLELIPGKLSDKGSEIRQKSVTLIAKYLDGEGSEKGLKLAEEIEEAIYSEFGDPNDHKYRSRIRSRFAKMTPEEMATPELRELRDKLAGEALEQHMLPQLEVPGNDNYKKSENAV
ncbi:unnamed protein product [Gongylonema pulchrum]|uniref:TFIIS central domain-containing protein n=2 Tax=Gongylonema pulchrum TaxID=637853 RepID=A0A183EF48_9BILA|nr:unnamed protein product [Gongylonema pulchrum]